MNFKTIQYATRNVLGSHPFLFPLLKLRFKDYVITKQTDICIEGPPRSANSFALKVFLLQNPGCRVAHHVHVSMQVLYAVRYRIPCIVLLREPSEVLSSLLIVDRNLSIETAVRSYVDFYRQIQHVRSAVVVAEFDDVIAGFPKVISQVNAKYGTSFNAAPITKEVVASIFSEMEAEIVKKKQPRLLTPVPKKEKEVLKQGVKEKLYMTPVFHEAQAVYDEWRAD